MSSGPSERFGSRIMPPAAALKVGDSVSVLTQVWGDAYAKRMHGKSAADSRLEVGQDVRHRAAQRWRQVGNRGLT